MYIGKWGLVLLVVVAIAVGLGFALFVSPNREQLSNFLIVGIAFVIAAAVLGGGVFLLRRRNFQLPPYWALKSLSIILKAIATTMFIAAIAAILFFIVNSITGPSARVGSSLSGDFPLLIGVISPVWILYWGIACISTYASGQLIDLFMSIEASLKTLAGRRRPNQPD